MKNFKTTAITLALSLSFGSVAVAKTTEPLVKVSLSKSLVQTIKTQDGFSLAPNSQMGVREFVEKVVPILQERRIYHTDYEGDTLREHLEVSHQYGLKG
ncbi:hypothetical protein [Moraxella oculi]|uniref:Uncharacterized protein n=1 Tax=Moraxella oculi TaxID=2940516 RepID=A0ABW8U7I2_9GAMM